MADFVIKRDGSKEAFDEDKMKKSIEDASREAGLNEDKIADVVDEVSGAVIQMADEKDEISTSDLREEILNELDELEPSVSQAWRDYNKERGRE